MNLGWLAFAGMGAAIAAASVLAARRDDIAPWEMRVFRAVNRLPEWLYRLVWLPMQLGNLVVGTVLGLVCAWVAEEWAVAIGVILAAILKLVTERILRREMADFLAIRQRPGTSQPGAVLRGDVPASGPSFPSGHVILVAAIGTVVAPTLPFSWAATPVVIVALVMIGRVYVGAHNPLDVAAGLGAGLLLGGPLAALVG